MKSVTMKEAKFLWRNHTQKALARELGRAKPTWSQREDGTPVVTVLWASFVFLRGEDGYVYARDTGYARDTRFENCP